MFIPEGSLECEKAGTGNEHTLSCDPLLIIVNLLVDSLHILHTYTQTHTHTNTHIHSDMDHTILCTVFFPIKYYDSLISVILITLGQYANE